MTRFAYGLCFGDTDAELRLEATYWGRRCRQALDRGFSVIAYRCALRAAHAYHRLQERCQ